MANSPVINSQNYVWTKHLQISGILRSGDECVTDLMFNCYYREGEYYSDVLFQKTSMGTTYRGYPLALAIIDEAYYSDEINKTYEFNNQQLTLQDIIHGINDRDKKKLQLIHENTDKVYQDKIDKLEKK